MKDTIRIILVGKTGSGKSSTGNTIVGKQTFETNVSASSITDSCRQAIIRRRGKNIHLVDTPGFFKTGMSIEQVKLEILDCFSMVLPGPHVILYVSKIGRCTDEEIQSLHHFRQLFPGSPYPYTIMMFTGSDYFVTTNKTESTENHEIKYLTKLPKEFKKFLEKCNQPKMFFSNKLRDVKSIEKQTESLFDIIDQMMEENDYTFYQNDNPEDLNIDMKKSTSDETVTTGKQAIICALKLVEYTSNILFPLWILLARCGHVEHSWKLYGIIIGIRGLVELMKKIRQKHQENILAKVHKILKKDHSVCVVS